VALARGLKVLRSHATPLASGAGPLAASPPRGGQPLIKELALAQGTLMSMVDVAGQKQLIPHLHRPGMTVSHRRGGAGHRPGRRSAPGRSTPGLRLVRRAPRGIHRRAPRICRLMTKYSRAQLPTYPAIAVTCAVLFCGSPIEAAVLRARLGTASAPRRTPRSESSACEMFEPHHRGSPRR